jgi:hypothetical protein
MMNISVIFCLVGIWSFIMAGIGSKTMAKSEAMFNAAFA